MSDLKDKLKKRKVSLEKVAEDLKKEDIDAKVVEYRGATEKERKEQLSVQEKLKEAVLGDINRNKVKKIRKKYSTHSRVVK